MRMPSDTRHSGHIWILGDSWCVTLLWDMLEWVSWVSLGMSLSLVTCVLVSKRSSVVRVKCRFCLTLTDFSLTAIYPLCTEANLGHTKSLGAHRSHRSLMDNRPPCLIFFSVQCNGIFDSCVFWSLSLKYPFTIQSFQPNCKTLSLPSCTGKSFLNSLGLRESGIQPGALQALA